MSLHGTNRPSLLSEHEAITSFDVIEQALTNTHAMDIIYQSVCDQGEKSNATIRPYVWDLINFNHSTHLQLEEAVNNDTLLPRHITSIQVTL